MLGWNTDYKKTFGNLSDFQGMVGYLELCVATDTFDMETVPRLAFNPSLTEKLGTVDFNVPNEVREEHKSHACSRADLLGKRVSPQDLGLCEH